MEFVLDVRSTLFTTPNLKVVFAKMAFTKTTTAFVNLLISSQPSAKKDITTIKLMDACLAWKDAFNVKMLNYVPIVRSIIFQIKEAV